MFTHRAIKLEGAQHNWKILQGTVSREKAFQATSSIGEMAAQDMLDLSGESPQDIDRIYVKLRDGMPMASGMRKVLPNVDVRYVVSQEKQDDNPLRALISFWDDYDGYSSDVVWFADPMNATGHTASESLKYIRQHFRFEKALISHVAANIVGIKRVQTTLDDFSAEGYMNYAFLSKRLDAKGYMEDGLKLTRDLGDKLWGTLGEDYSIYDIQNELRNLVKTQAGKVEVLNGTILHLVQKSRQEGYLADRLASWMTKDWISAALQWYCAVQEFPIRRVNVKQVHMLVDTLCERVFLRIENRPWKKGFADVYTITEDGITYTSSVYLPILDELGILQKIGKHYDYLIHLTPEKIRENVKDKSWR